MLKRELTEEHKTIMRRHYAESVATGASPEVIHRELYDQIFQQRYSMQQVTATTSWISGEILKGRRVNDIAWKEGDENTNEDADFDNPEKNVSRNWHVEQVQRHTTLEARQNINFLLLPGQNEHDYNAFTGIGMQAKNFLTFIRADHPKAVAQYLRNCRKHGVKNNRVGEMNEQFPNESVSLQGAYIDYFGMFCPDISIDSHLLPLDPNYYPICIGYNLKKGREHGSTKEHANKERARREYVSERAHTVKTGKDILLLNYEGEAAGENGELGMSELRDEIVYTEMFANAGTAQQKNWICQDLLTDFTKLEPAYAGFHDMPVMEQYLAVRNQLKNLIGLVSLADQHVDSLRIFGWLSDIAAGVARGVINTPVIRHLAEPIDYISGESNKPFRSYFGVLETKKAQYEKYTAAIEFIFAFGTMLFKNALKISKNEMSQVRINIHDILKVVGMGSKKEITIFESSKPIAKINHDFLLEARMELGISSCSAQHPGDSYERYYQREVKILDEIKADGRAEEGRQRITAMAMKGLSQMGGMKMAGRNAPCSCGSGKKFKKCCGGH